MPNATIKDVAKRAGVSIATVSRVVNQNYKVGPEVQKRVRKAIEELNYVPNRVAKSLKGVRTSIIGMLVSNLGNAHYTSVAKAVEEVVNKEDYNIIICSTNEDPERELRLLRMFEGRQVEGIILNTTGSNNEYIARLSHKIPIVLLERKINDPGFVGDLVNTNSQEGIKMLTKRLIDSGHRRIGLVCGPKAASTSWERSASFFECLRDSGIPVPDDPDKYPYLYKGKLFVEDGYKGAKFIMEREDPPTAIVFLNNTMTLGALRYFRQTGIKVPGDVSIVCYGKIDQDILYVQPENAGVQAYTLGQQAGRFLLERIKDPNLDSREIVISYQYYEGNSIREIHQ